MYFLFAPALIALIIGLVAIAVDAMRPGLAKDGDYHSLEADSVNRFEHAFDRAA